jgi:hypothetical protein
MAEEIIREYDMDDLLMLQRAQVFHDNFITDQATFVADFPHLATPFETEFQTAIDDADDLPSGAEVDGEIAVITEQLNDQLPIARKALQKLYTYVELAWNSKARDNEFGRNKYEKSRNSQIKMKELLELAHRVAEKPANKTALLAVGYTQGAIDELQTIENEIDSLNALQEEKLSSRGVKTETRIKAFNNVFSYMQSINKASKVTFADSQAKIDQYMLYPTSSSSLPKPQGLNANYDGVDPTQAILTWDTVAGADTYKIYYSEVNLGQPSGNFGELMEVGNVNYLTLPIVANKTNYWKIKAYGGGLSSAYSDEVFLDGAA